MKPTSDKSDAFKRQLERANELEKENYILKRKILELSAGATVSLDIELTKQNQLYRLALEPFAKECDERDDFEEWKYKQFTLEDYYSSVVTPNDFLNAKKAISLNEGGENESK